jgi:hypothetical protein
MRLTNFYEVKDSQSTVWGGNSALQAVEWYRRGLDHRLYVSVWDEQDQDNPVMVTDKIEVTSLVMATLYDEKERA